MKTPRLGFLGAGWIGRARLRALVEAGVGRVVAVADPEPAALAEVRALAPEAELLASYDVLLARELDAVVIATPSALHAEQCLAAFERGLAVFCQKPLGRTAAEVTRITGAARRVNRPLGVDFSYRRSAAMQELTRLVRSGALGEPYAVDATFHNAYGPDQGWANDPARAGGGCLIDLGVHLLDAALALLPEAEPVNCTASLYAAGRALALPPSAVEDFAVAQLAFAGGASVRLTCSWRSSFGAEAGIRLACFGTQASAAFENVGGSFYDFRCELYRGKEREVRVEPPDAWGGRELVAFVEELAAGGGYREDPRLLRVARCLDLLYGRATLAAPESARLPAAAASA